MFEETIVTGLFHKIAGGVALLTIATFWLSSVAVELWGDLQAIAFVKRAIVFALPLLILAMIATGGSGARLSKGRQSALVAAKQKRMAATAANGLFVLVPCAIILHLWASAGVFDRVFYTFQGIELLAGAANLSLLGLNMRDGLRMTAGKRRMTARNRH